LPARAAIMPAILLLCGWLSMPLYADGGILATFIPLDEGLSTDQRAIVVRNSGAGTETMVLSTRYDGPAADFAWVIPLPSLPSREQVSTVPNGEQMFTELSQRTQPMGIIQEYVGGGCGCVGGGGQSPADTVELVDHIVVSGLEISFLEATDSTDLLEWLNANGYLYPPTALSIVDFYVQKGWKFVTVKVDTPDARQGGPSEGYFPSAPLKLTFATDQLVFPLHISAVSTHPTDASILLYVFDQHRVREAALPSADMQMPDGIYESAAEFRMAYEQAFRSRLAELGGRALLIEYAGPAQCVEDADSSLKPLLQAGSSRYLTRLRTVMTPVQMTDDITLVQNDTDAPVDLQMAAYAGGLFRTGLLALTLALGFFFLLRMWQTVVPFRRALVEAVWVALAVVLAIGIT